MKIFVERKTGQAIIPGIITENTECRYSHNGTFGDNYKYCNEGKVWDYHLDEPLECPICKGTGKFYEEIDYADEEGVPAA